MLKPPMPNVAGMTDTLEFVKQLWGGMNIPGMPGVSGLPGSTLSTDELDKKIADLKAVESWLNLNIGMLRGTIQALEVQRGTLAALKTMSESMAQAMGKTGGDAPMAPFAQFFGQAAPATPAGAQPGSPPPSRPDAGVPNGAADTGAGAAAAMPAAVAWWNLLQEQFRQAVASTMPAETKGGDDKAAPAAAGTSGGTAPGDAASNARADASPAGNDAPGRGARTARSKADKA
ncbi:PhaM family polyhydroxyalkanoate granule multifunctional regulatory protein [Massilia sp. DD77]|uniref:PhaM family polyhydroxyalkanoate granule multifunctional regulatory protein n=1 Tax=Massilia sp. DD77 TaxID=3109349 RepID=UPI002FFFB07F